MKLARGFSRQHRIIHFTTIGSASGLRLYVTRICLRDVLHPYPGTTTARAGLPSCVTPSLNYYPVGPAAPPLPSVRRPPGGFTALAFRGSSLALQSGYGNINPLSIDYACRPRLRSRLTLGRSAWPRNPWSIGAGVSHSCIATHACILTRIPSTTRFPCGFTRHTTLPYPSTHPLGLLCEWHGFGGVLEPRYIVGAESLDQWAITHSLKGGCF